MKVHRKHTGWVISAATLCTLAAAPAFSASSGHDWYCPESDAHAQFEQHRQKYHDFNVDQVVDVLEKLYQDETLSPETRKAQATELLKDYSVKVKLGEGD